MSTVRDNRGESRRHNVWFFKTVCLCDTAADKYFNT